MILTLSSDLLPTASIHKIHKFFILSFCSLFSPVLILIFLDIQMFSLGNMTPPTFYVALTINHRTVKGLIKIPYIFFRNSLFSFTNFQMFPCLIKYLSCREQSVFLLCSTLYLVLTAVSLNCKLPGAATCYLSRIGPPCTFLP